MARVLIVEDEAVLRTSLVRGLGKMEDVVVDAAGTVDQALILIDANAPDVIVSDIDMPERTGIELLGELGKRELHVPIIFVSAYLKAYAAQIPRHANIEVLEKPVGLHDLRELIRERLSPSEQDSGPFSVPDFLQLASLGRRSVAIEARWDDGSEGSIVVCNGEVWHAQMGDLKGEQAFATVAWREGAQVRCRAVNGDPGPRTLEGGAEALLMNTAQQLDETKRDSEQSYVERALRHSATPPEEEMVHSWRPEDDPPPSARPFLESEPPPPATKPEPGHALQAEPEPEPDPVQAAFERQLDRGVGLLLERNYEEAYAAFAAAEAISPGHRTVVANLGRLREMGYGDASPEDEG